MSAIAEYIGNTGTDFSQPITLKDSAGAAFDFTTYTLTCEIRTRIDDGVVKGTLKATATLTTVVAASGTLNIELTDTQADAIGKGEWYGDIKAVDGSGDIFRSDPFKLKMEGEVTE